MKDIWTRLLAWVQTLKALQQTKHYQAMVAGTRSIFEMVIDIALLCDDKTDESAIKMVAFMRSEQLKVAQSVVDFFGENNLPNEHSVFLDFIRENRTHIQSLRKQYWPNPRKNGKGEHPKRWTNNPLPDDITMADRSFGRVTVAELGKSLTEYYATNYRRLSWDAHSGLASVWEQPAEIFDVKAGFAYFDSANLALLATKLIMIDFQLSQAIPDFDDVWRQVRSLGDQEFMESLDKAKTIGKFA